MTRNLTPDELALATLLVKAPSTIQLIRAVAAWSSDQRAATEKLLKKGIPALKAYLETQHYVARHRLVVIAAAVNTTPTQAAATLELTTVWHLRSEDALDEVVRLLSEHGPQWATQFIAALMAKRDVVERVSPLVTRLVQALDLPVPDAPAPYWRGWSRDHSIPQPGIRWLEHRRAAWAVPDALAFDSPYPLTRAEHVAQVRQGAATLRAQEHCDDDALLADLLRVAQRGDRPQAQRMAMLLLEGLDMEPLLWDHRAQLLAALPQADSTVAKVAVEHLLRPELGEGELTALALAILPRREKGPKRAVLRRLQATSPLPELIQTVADLAAGSDTASAQLARDVLQAWGEQNQPESPEAVGLWREPGYPAPGPLTDSPDDALDEVAFTELMSQADGSPQFTERVLAAMVASAATLGVERMREIIGARTEQHWSTWYAPRILHALATFAVTGSVAEPPVPMEPSLAYPAAQRIAQAISAMGMIPCLLSAPTHEGLRVSWEAFAARAAGYRQRGAECLSTDVAVALTRLDPAEVPDDMTALDQPIRGVSASLREVISRWRHDPAAPATLTLSSETTAGGYANRVSSRLQICGDAPKAADLLALPAPWWAECPTGRVGLENEEWGALMPQHTARQACAALGAALQRGPAGPLLWLEYLAAIARPFPRPLTLLALTCMSVVPAKDRDRVAEPLLGAWDEGRLTPEELVGALRSDWAARLEFSPAKIAACFTLVADAGGLALAWPVWVAVAADLTAAENVPATTGGVLEILLRYLPEVQAAGVPVALPHVAALAARGGRTKAIETARLLAERCATLAG